MSKIIELELGNFIDENNRVFLVRCPKCGKENYAMNVSNGICTWCGLDGQEYYKDELFKNSKK